MLWCSRKNKKIENAICFVYEQQLNNLSGVEHTQHVLPCDLLVESGVKTGKRNLVSNVSAENVFKHCWFFTFSMSTAAYTQQLISVACSYIVLLVLL